MLRYNYIEKYRIKYITHVRYYLCNIWHTHGIQCLVLIWNFCIVRSLQSGEEEQLLCLFSGIFPSTNIVACQNDCMYTGSGRMSKWSPKWRVRWSELVTWPLSSLVDRPVERVCLLELPVGCLASCACTLWDQTRRQPETKSRAYISIVENVKMHVDMFLILYHEICFLQHDMWSQPELKEGKEKTQICKFVCIT